MTKTAHLLAIAVDEGRAILQHEIGHDAGHVAIWVVKLLSGANDVVRYCDGIFHPMHFGQIGQCLLSRDLGDAVRVLRSRLIMLLEWHLIGAVAGHRTAEHDATSAVANGRGEY